MITIKQSGLIDELLTQLNDNEASFCKPIISNLLDLGYTPRKHKKSTFVIEFEKYGRIMTKMEVSREKGLIFWLRFSAGAEYSQIFQDAVKRRPEAWVKRNQEWENHDVQKCCGLCKGNPRFYHHINDNGNIIKRCGGYTIAVPGVTSKDVPEILRLIKEQDEYFNMLCG